MKNRKCFTLVGSTVELMVVFLTVASVVPWAWNVAEFASCDFEPNWDCEVIHGTGVFIPPAALITVWFDDDGA